MILVQTQSRVLIRSGRESCTQHGRVRVGGRTSSLIFGNSRSLYASNAALNLLCNRRL